MDATSAHNHSWRETKRKGNAMLRSIILTGMLIGTLVASLPSTTFALGRGAAPLTHSDEGKSDEGKHSLVQHPYSVRSVLATLQAEIDTLNAQVNLLNATNTSLQAALAALKTAQADIVTLKGSVVTLQGSVVKLEAKPAGIPSLDKYLTIDTNPIDGVTGPHILITGANVHILSGSKATDDNIATGGTLTGLGNLIIGYNEQSPTSPLLRTGSHNLVGGSQNSFSSTGGMVFGLRNTLSGQYAAIVSGDTNIASGPNASVLGGNLNRAVGTRSTVYGGLNNPAVNMNAYSPIQATRPTGN